MKYIFFSIALLACTMAFAQGKTELKADKMFELMNYTAATTQYERVHKAEPENAHVLRRLAQCYNYRQELEKSAAYYAKLRDVNGMTNNDYLAYAQVQQELESFAKAKPMMDSFSQKASGDMRAVKYIENKDFETDILNQETYFSITPTNVNSEFSDFGGYTKNGKVYFLSNRDEVIGFKTRDGRNDKPLLDMYRADADGAQLSNIRVMGGTVNTKFHEGSLCFTPDGSAMYFTRNNISKESRRDPKGIQRLKIYKATLNEAGYWANEKELPFCSSDYSVGHPTLSADGKTLYFTSDMPGSFGGPDIYSVAIMGDDKYGTPTNLGKEINTEGKEMFPWIGMNGELFFSSDGHLGLGGLDVFAASMVDNNYAKAINVGKPVNSNRDDFALNMYDAENGYVSSNREGGKGDDDIYAIKMIKPIGLKTTVAGVVSDAATNKALAGATIKLTDKAGNPIAETTADEDGKYEFPLEPDQSYVLTAQLDDFYDKLGDVSTKNIKEGSKIEKDLALDKDPGIGLWLMISDTDSEEPIPGVKVTLLDNMTNENLVDGPTDNSGSVRRGLEGKKLQDRISINVILERDGYLTKRATFNHKIIKEGEIPMHEYMKDLGKMDKVVEGADVGKMINVQPIYFDLGKHKIRPDAATELDKIVQVMQDNPQIAIELGAHTDARGRATSNQSLSERRAKSSRDYIVSKGIEGSRLTYKGYGEEKLLNKCKDGVKCSEEEHQLNRRTEFIIVKF